MDLKSGYPYSLIKNGLPYEYPKLHDSIRTEVVVVGGGISGALMAFYLVEAGIDCVVIDSRTIGLGSTCASTSLLQYEIDIPLWKLKTLIGEEKAVRAYRLCAESVNTLGNIAGKIGLDDFTFTPSVYYAAHENDTDHLQKEYNARQQAGFDVSYLESDELYRRYGFKAPGAIVSALAAHTDAYRMTHHLHQYTLAQGGRVFDRTEAVHIHTNGQVRIETAEGCTITAQKVVYATGYEVAGMLKKNTVQLRSTYATISEPLGEDLPFWADNALLWNTADPYLYIRSTPDRRILVGGRDDRFHQPKRRDKRIPGKTRQLTDDFRQLFPDLEFVPEFSWAGTFGSTRDGLPYIGPHKNYPDSYFSLGFGGNGITFSLIGAEIVRDACLGKKNPDAHLFSFDR